MARAAYAVLLWLALPLVLARLWWRGRIEPEYRSDVAARFGLYPRNRPAAGRTRPLVWLHAVSLGETRAAQPLFRLLQQRLEGCDFLVTHMTATGRRAAQELFGGQAELAWLPYDYPFAVRRFLDRYRPSLGVLVETELWFNLVRSCATRGVPLLLANARLSEKSARGYEAAGALAREAFGALSAAAAQTAADAGRLERLGARNVRVVGNMKFDVRPAPQLDALAAEFRRGYGARKVFLAASTREGEEELILEALSADPLPGVLKVIVPRHPQRFDEVAALLARAGVAFSRRSAGTEVAPEHDFVLGDSLGELHAYYAACDVAFIGGSLLPYGAHNLIEACAAGAAVLIGPSTYNFAQAAQAAMAEGAARQVSDARSLLAQARELLAHDSARAAMGEAGRAFCARHRGAAEGIAALAQELLAELPSRRAGR